MSQEHEEPAPPEAAVLPIEVQLVEPEKVGGNCAIPLDDIQGRDA